jgi:hypothetical protein
LLILAADWRYASGMMGRLTWPEIRQNGMFRGRWVALCDCVYDEQARPVAGQVIDADEDLVALCARMQEEGDRHCAIHFCDAEPTSWRPTH